MSTDVQPTFNTPPLPDDATARLRRMLESVRLDKSTSPAEPAAQSLNCPQCNSVEPWGNSSWCPECGYYPKLGRAMTPVEIETNNNQLPRVSCAWLGWLMLGMFGILLGSIALKILIPDVVERGPVGRIAFVAGLTLLVVAQVRAYVLSSHGADHVPLSAIFFEPFQLWKAVLKQLPKSRMILYWGGWGSTTMLLALMVVGLDFDGMFSGFRPKKKGRNPMHAMVKAIAATEGQSAFSDYGEEEEFSAPGGSASGPAGNGDVEGAMKEFAGAAGTESLTAGNGSGKSSGGGSAEQLADGAAAAASSPAESLKTGPQPPDLDQVPVSPTGHERTDHAEFVIFGYSTNSAGEMRSILLAQVEKNRARFVSKMSLDETDGQLRERLQQALDGIRTHRAALHIPYQARWVAPLVKCRVAYVGWTPDGRLREGYLLSYDDSQLKSPAE